MSNNVEAIKNAINSNLGRVGGWVSQSSVQHIAEQVARRGESGIRETVISAAGIQSESYTDVVDNVVKAIEAIEGIEETKTLNTTVTEDDVKAAIINVVGASTASTVQGTIDRVARAVANRGDAGLREAIVESAGSYANSYPEYVNDLVKALEAHDKNDEADASIKNIKHTIGDSLPAVHIPAGYLQNAVDALTEREYTIVENIVSAASLNFPSIGAEVVEEILSKAGLSIRPLPVVEEVEEDDNTDSEEAYEEENGTDEELASEEEEDATFPEEGELDDSAVEGDSDSVAKKGKKSKKDKRFRKMEKQVNKLVELANRHLGANI